MTFGRRTLAPMPQSGNPKPTLRRCSKSKPRYEEDEYEDIYCQKCGSGDQEDELLLCDKCDLGFHIFCLRPVLVAIPKGSWFCKSCTHQKSLTQFPLVQTKIIDFFRIQRGQITEKHSPAVLKKRKRSGSIFTKKKSRRLLPFNPTEDPERRLEQMASLATALTATGAEYSNELTYVPGMAPRSANCPAFELDGMQVLSTDDVDSLIMCKNMMERGECPPLMVVFDPIEGFTVEADRHIKDLTIITEYVGDVDYLNNRKNDDGDSTMALLYAADPSKSLVVCPDKRSNIARFINGINNHTLDGKKKQNLKCVRFNVNGECRVLLIANRDIKKGERLYYDYNGYKHEYPTEHFV